MPRSGLHLAKPETVLFEAIDNAGRNRINVRLASCAIADTLKPLKFGAYTDIPAEVVFHANPERSTRRHRELAEVDVTGFKPHIFIELVAAGQSGASTRTFIVAGEARKISIQS